MSERDKRDIVAWFMGFISGLGLGLILATAFPAHASHVNELADPSIWIDPKPNDDQYIYREDACVDALRGAMQRMEPFIPTVFKRDGDLWHTSEYLTVDGMQEREEAHRQWEEVKIMCWRH